MLKTSADLDRVGDSFVALAEHPEFVRSCVAHRDPRLERRLWHAAVKRRLVAPEVAGGPIPMARFDAAGLVHGTLPGTGLTPVIFCWFDSGDHGLFIAADLIRGNDYHRLTGWRPRPRSTAIALEPVGALSPVHRIAQLRRMWG